MTQCVAFVDLGVVCLSRADKGLCPTSAQLNVISGGTKATEPHDIRTAEQSKSFTGEFEALHATPPAREAVCAHAELMTISCCHHHGQVHSTEHGRLPQKYDTQ
jgi:hypothetical protein